VFRAAIKSDADDATIVTMKHPIHALTALWSLLILASRTRFRLNGAYWSWRQETAFGADPSRWPSRRARREAMLHYGRWVHTMRRLR